MCVRLQASGFRDGLICKVNGICYIHGDAKALSELASVLSDEAPKFNSVKDACSIGRPP
jgi:hypothetical protein